MQLGSGLASPCGKSKSCRCARFLQIFIEFQKLQEFCLHFYTRYLKLEMGRSSKNCVLTLCTSQGFTDEIHICILLLSDTQRKGRPPLHMRFAYICKATLLLYFEHLSNSAPNVTEWVGARLSRTGGTASDLLDGRRVGPRAPTRNGVERIARSTNTCRVSCRFEMLCSFFFLYRLKHY